VFSRNQGSLEDNAAIMKGAAWLPLSFKKGANAENHDAHLPKSGYKS
jgi:hypothetical protein